MCMQRRFHRKKPDKSFDMKQVDRGRYLVMITGCNDCHTPGCSFQEEKYWRSYGSRETGLDGVDRGEQLTQ